tara:strand:- start:1057 stop:1593 length:537 start_codon:yes stop_codon:yes gene_type:complete
MSTLKDLKDQEKLAQMLVDKFDGTIDSDGDFQLRNTNRIDIAQVKAEEYLDSKNIIYKNIGFDSKDDRIPSAMWFQVPSFLRCMPDLLVYASNSISFLEVKGCRDEVKFKIDDLHEYNLWNGIAPVRFFVYSNTEDEKWVLSLADVWNRLGSGKFGKYEDNNKIYLAIDCKQLEDYKR